MKPLIPQALILAFAINAFPAIAGDFELGVAASNSQAVLIDKEGENEFSPVINYQGEKFSIQFGALSYQLYASDGWLLTLYGEGRSAGYKASDSKALTGMDEREDAFDAGFQIAHGGNWGVIQLKLLNDITDTHQGYEASLAYIHPWEQGRWVFEPAIGIKAQSKDLVNYYYGVKDSESTASRQAYTADSTVNSFAEFSIGYRINRKWTVIGGMELEQLGKEITASPIVDKDYKLTTFSALMYTF